MSSFFHQLGTIFGDKFSFAYPWILLGLLLIPLLSWLQGRKGGGGLLFSSTSLVAKLGQVQRSHAGSFLMKLLYGAMASLIIALARPQWSNTTTHIEASGIDIMIALDVSGSMGTEDYKIGGQQASRLEATKQVTQQFIEARPNDRIGIVAFAGRPYLVSPITLDHDWLIQNLDRIQLGLVEDGTAIGSALASAASRLKNKEAKSKLIVLLTDGANNAGKVMPLTAAEAARALGIRVYTIGAGSDGPVSIPLRDTFGRVFMQKVTFPFDEKLLQDIAKIGEGKYFRAADENSLEKTFREIDRLEKSSVTLDKKVHARDFFGWFIALALILVTVEMILSQTRWNRIP